MGPSHANGSEGTPKSSNAPTSYSDTCTPPSQLTDVSNFTSLTSGSYHHLNGRHSAPRPPRIIIGTDPPPYRGPTSTTGAEAAFEKPNLGDPFCSPNDGTTLLASSLNSTTFTAGEQRLSPTALSFTPAGINGFFSGENTPTTATPSTANPTNDHDHYLGFVTDELIVGSRELSGDDHYPLRPVSSVLSTKSANTLHPGVAHKSLQDSSSDLLSHITHLLSITGIGSVDVRALSEILMQFPGAARDVRTIPAGSIAKAYISFWDLRAANAVHGALTSWHPEWALQFLSAVPTDLALEQLSSAFVGLNFQRSTDAPHLVEHGKVILLVTDRTAAASLSDSYSLILHELENVGAIRSARYEIAQDNVIRMFVEFFDVRASFFVRQNWKGLHISNRIVSVECDSPKFDRRSPKSPHSLANETAQFGDYHGSIAPGRLISPQTLAVASSGPKFDPERDHVKVISNNHLPTINMVSRNINPSPSFDDHALQRGNMRPDARYPMPNGLDIGVSLRSTMRSSADVPRYHSTISRQAPGAIGQERGQTPFAHPVAVRVPSGRSTPSGRFLGHRDAHDGGNHNVVDVERIRQGLDVRTTIMLRNIPNKIDQAMLKTIVDETSRGKFDFMYLRIGENLFLPLDDVRRELMGIDFANNCNVGYAFINFEDPFHIIEFVRARAGMSWNCFNSDKVAEVSYATIQGSDCLVQKFRNSSVMLENPSFRPKLFSTGDGPNAGKEIPFPEVDNPSKMRRSCENAGTTGLYPPRAGQHRRDEQRRSRSQWDRGTTLAAREEVSFSVPKNIYSREAELYNHIPSMMGMNIRHMQPHPFLPVGSRLDQLQHY